VIVEEREIVVNFEDVIVGWGDHSAGGLVESEHLLGVAFCCHRYFVLDFEVEIHPQIIDVIAMIDGHSICFGL
jgi:hypothetical protein